MEKSVRGNRCGCLSSSAICGCISRGTGELDEFGFWQYPCPHGSAFMPYDNYCSIHTNESLKTADYMDLVWAETHADDVLYNEIEVELTLRDIALQQLQPEVN